MSDDGIIKLITKTERDAREEHDYVQSAHDEAISMLETALASLRERRWGDGSRVTGLAISFAFENGCYGRMIPTIECRAAALIGSVATTEHDLILRTLVSPG